MSTRSTFQEWTASTILVTEDQDSMLWTIIFGFIIAFVLAFAVGANDVANTFGTTVGAKVLTLRSACILATIFETLGAVLIGAKVGETIRKGIIDVSIYNMSDHGRELLMIGEVSAMSGAAIWQLFATVFGLPVSGTHSIVGACIGFSLVAVGSTGVKWKQLGFIIASWFVSPVLSGFLSVCLFYFLSRFILEKDDPLQNGLRFLPLFYAFTLGINGFSIVYSGAPLLGLNDLPFWSISVLSAGTMIVTAIVVQFVVVPRVRRKALKGTESPKKDSSSSSDCDSLVKYRASTSGNNEASVRIVECNYRNEKESSKHTKIVLKQENKQEIRDIADSFSSLEGKSQSRDSSLFGSSYEAPRLLASCKSSYDGDKSDSRSEVNVTWKAAPLKLSSKGSYDADDSDSALQEKLSLKPQRSVCNSGSIGLDRELDGEEEEDPLSVKLLFSFLQVITSCFGSFAHGGNDVSNAIGPLIALWLIYQSGNVGQGTTTPWYLLLYGGAGIVIGLWILGRRVIQTIGSDLTKLTPSRGFCIEVTSALTVLLASNIGIPVSTTHCKVGSIVSIGWLRSHNAVQWSMVRNIAIAWFVTLPVSGLISAGVMYLLMNVVM